MIWLIVALLVGGGLLAGAVALDWRARRRSEREVPRRGVEEVDQHVPMYVSQEVVDATPGPSGTTAPRGREFPLKLAHPQLAASRGIASLEGPRMLFVAGSVTSMRQLLAPMAAHPVLVVFATELSEEVGATLAANRRMLDAQVLACHAGPGDLVTLAKLTGGEVLSDDDLRAGYIPESALGTAKTFSADPKRCWIEP